METSFRWSGLDWIQMTKDMTPKMRRILRQGNCDHGVLRYVYQLQRVLVAVESSETCEGATTADSEQGAIERCLNVALDAGSECRYSRCGLRDKTGMVPIPICMQAVQYILAMSARYGWRIENLMVVAVEHMPCCSDARFR